MFEAFHNICACNNPHYMPNKLRQTRQKDSHNYRSNCTYFLRNHSYRKILYPHNCLRLLHKNRFFPHRKIRLNILHLRKNLNRLHKMLLNILRPRKILRNRHMRLYLLHL